MYYIIVSNKGGGRFAEKAKSENEAFVFLNSHKKLGAQSVSIYKEPFWNSTDYKSLVAFYGKGSYWDNVSKRNKLINDKRVE